MFSESSETSRANRCTEGAGQGQGGRGEGPGRLDRRVRDAAKLVQSGAADRPEVGRAFPRDGGNAGFIL